MKYAIIAFAAFMQLSAFAAMPNRCFTPSYFVTCERVQITAWANLYKVNWESVNALRSFDHE